MNLLGGLGRQLSQISGMIDQPQGPRTLRTGMSGLDVARCQNLLNENLPNSNPPLWVDGIFGANTDRRVREFQRIKQLTVDGLAGPQTRAVLEAGHS